MLAQWIDNSSLFDSLRPEWDELLSHSSSDTVFLTWEWLRTWWTHLGAGRKLAILTLREDDGRLIAIAPFAIERGSLRRGIPFSRLTFLGAGTVGSDYLDFIVRRGFEAEAMREITQAIAARDLAVELGQLGPGAQAFQFLPAHWTPVRTRVNACPYLDLRGHTWTSYLATLGSEHRYNVQRKLKNLAKNFSVAFEHVADAGQLAPALDLLIGLHEKRWSEHGESDAFHTAGHVAFHREFTARALERGWLRLFLLRLNGQPASALYGLRYGRTFNFYQSGFDPEYSRNSVGLATMALAIQHAIEDGAEEYDFLHGEESYKFHWAKLTRELTRMELFPAGLPGRILHARSRLRVALGSQQDIDWAAGFLTPAQNAYL